MLLKRLHAVVCTLSVYKSRGSRVESKVEGKVEGPEMSLKVREKTQSH